MYASKWARAAIMPKNCVPWIRLRCNSSDSASVKPVGHTLFGSDIVFSLWKTPYCSCSTRTRVLWHPLPQNRNNLLFLSVILILHISLSIKIYIFRRLNAHPWKNKEITELNQWFKEIEKSPFLGLLWCFPVKFRCIRPLRPGFRPDPWNTPSELAPALHAVAPARYQSPHQLFEDAQ